MPSGFVHALERHSREVQKLEGAQADEFLRLLKDLRDQLRGRLAGMGGADDDFNAFHLLRVQAETEDAIRTLEHKAGLLYDRAADEAVELSIAHNVEEIDRLSKAFGEPLDVSIDSAKVLADPIQGLLANHFDSSVKKYGIDRLNGVRRELFLGNRQGLPFGDVVRNVAGEMGPFGTVAKADAKRLARTEVSNAYGAAQHSGLREAKGQIPGLVKMWLHIGSYRCETCMPLHGTTRPVDGTWTIRIGKKVREVSHAPGHPCCVCRTTAMTPKWKSGMQRLGYLNQDPDDAQSSPARL